jgi:hypothetical protein
MSVTSCSARFRDPRFKLAALVASTMFGALATSGAAFAACTGPGAPANTQTKCLTAVPIPGNPLRSYDISWVNRDRAEYYLGDRSNAGIDVIDTHRLVFKRTIGGFVGVKLNAAGTAVDNDHSGPDGVVSHGRWLYAGDGDSTLKVIDLDASSASAIKATLSTGGEARVDEMALTTDGELLLAVNNADSPPFATLFTANGDRNFNSVSAVSKITIDPVAFPDTPGIEQPTWDPKTRRFYVSVPNLGNPAGCVGACDGGLMVIDPSTVTPGTMVLGAFNAATNTGVLRLSDCGPNGATVGPHDNLLLGCTQANNPANRSTLVINATTKNFSHVNGIVGSDEVWFNKGDGRYYTGSNRNCAPAGCPAQAAVLGVIDGTSVLIETVPQSSGSHSVAADSKRNLIFVPQSAPVAAVGAGGDTTAVGAGICGTANDGTGTGCIAVYVHDVDKDKDKDDHDRDDR